MIYLILTSVILLSDLFCKQYVLDHRENGEETSVCNDRIILRNIRNYGFAMSHMKKFPEIVRNMAGLVNAAAAAVFAATLRKKGRRLEKTGLACIVGGGLSNLYDRICRGYVVDYISFRSRWKKFTDLVFNIGDFFIIGGSILYSIGRIFHVKK